jgi:hypothetical protein
MVFCVLPVESILGKAVPVGDTGTIPYSILQYADNFVCAAFDIKKIAADGSRWCFTNMWALSWSHERTEKYEDIGPLVLFLF